MDLESDSSCFYEITPENQNIRLDVFLSFRSSSLSRSRIKGLIKDGAVKVNGQSSKPGYIIKPGDMIQLTIPPPVPQVIEPEEVDFGVIYEDPSLLVLNKPPGVVVHPSPGHATGTLVHGLLQHCRDLKGIGGELRPGIVHRLDKDTSGLLVVAKTDRVHQSLSKQFKAGTVTKEYVALVHGLVKDVEGEIDLPIARHPKKRKEMAVVPERGRRALTLWKKIEDFQDSFSLLSVYIKTGRTHQIRVHFSHIGHPVVGDTVYGHGLNWWRRNLFHKKGLLHPPNRQMLHSRRLGFLHPDKDSYVEFEAPIPDDVGHILKILKRLNSIGTNKGLT